MKTKSDNPIRFFTISPSQWSKLKLYISGSNRPKFSTAVNSFFQKEFDKPGIDCIFVIKSNYFSVSRKFLPSKIFWKGIFVCKDCSKSIQAKISRKPVYDESTIFCYEYDGTKCNAPFKKTNYRKRLFGRERKQLQYEIHSKGTSNFWNEAIFFGDESKFNIGYDNIRKLSSQHRHRFQLEHDLRIDSDASKNIFDKLLPSSDLKGLKGYIQEINSNPYGAILISEIQVNLSLVYKLSILELN